TALERAEVAIVLLEVQEPLSEQDVRIVTTAVEAGRAVVLAFNKWDLLDDERRYYLEREIERDLSHVAWAPRVNISAKTGRHAEKRVPARWTALARCDARSPPGRLNAFLGELVAANPHPVRGGKQPRILFGTQAQSRPPKFVLFTTGFLDHGYRRFITRRLRETFGFKGTPIEASMRIREQRRARGGNEDEQSERPGSTDDIAGTSDEGAGTAGEGAHPAESAASSRSEAGSSAGTGATGPTENTAESSAGARSVTATSAEGNAGSAASAGEESGPATSAGESTGAAD